MNLINLNLKKSNIKEKVKKFLDKYYLPLSEIIIKKSYNVTLVILILKTTLSTFFLNPKLKILFKLFWQNKPVNYVSVVKNFSKEEFRILFESKILTKKKYVLSNFFILPYNGLYFFGDSHHLNKTRDFVYLSLESVAFLEFLKRFDFSNETLLEVGTGSGIISISLSNNCKKIIGCDINRRAIAFSKKNMLFNNYRKTKIKFINKSYVYLFNKKIDSIICNPPYMPMSTTSKIKPYYSYGGKTGIEFLKKLIIKFMDSSANKMFFVFFSGIHDNEIILEKFLKKFNVGYRLEILRWIPKYYFILKLRNNNEKLSLMKNLKEEGIDAFCYGFGKIEKNIFDREVLVKKKYISMVDYFTYLLIAFIFKIWYRYIKFINK